MSPLRLLAKHLALGILATLGVLTAVFAMFTLTDGRAAHDETGFGPGTMTGEETVFELYLTVVWNAMTLQWGRAAGGPPNAFTYTYEAGDPVAPLVFGSLARTAAYVIPAIAIGISIAVIFGLYVALRPESRLASVSMGSSYLLFAVPSFWVGGIALSVTLDGPVEYSPVVFEHVLPIALVTTTVLGAYVSYARAHALEYATAEFVRLVEAKGAGPVRIARHVLRNAAIPIVSMVFTEALGLLVLSVFVVEVLFAIEGIGLLLFGAADARDIPVLLGSVLVIVGIGVLTNALQDLSYGVLDPRVGTSQ